MLKTTTLLAFLCCFFPMDSNAASANCATGGEEIGFEEKFALAPDRARVLEQLIPGTAEHYYYSCLHHQNQGQLDRVPELLVAWATRHGKSSRYIEIENRQILLGYNRDPKGTFTALGKKLRLAFAHERDLADQETPLPSSLPAVLVSEAAWRKRALDRHGDSLDGFSPSIWPDLASAKLSDKQLRQFLKQLTRPDVPGLVSLVLRDLGTRSSRGFGSLPIHDSLLLTQLEDCLNSKPELLGVSSFINAYLKRLSPGADAGWRADPQERTAYLERLDAFVRRLPSAQNSLKAQVLQHRLLHDLAQGQLDRKRFMAFLRLPQRQDYVRPEMLERYRRTEIVDATRIIPALGHPGQAEPLVNKYLEHFFLTDNSYATFAEFVREDYLRRVFVETKILAGLGDRERWYSLLDDNAYYEQLEARVEIEFTPQSQTQFTADGTVALELNVKNVDTLLVKVFEIDAASFIRDRGVDVDASIDLDGLVAGSETTYTYSEPALRRVLRRFEFPELSKPGVYVIDFIGGGLSSRALIRKGKLHLRERLGSAGHVFQVLDETGNIQANASIQLGGHHYTAGSQGEIHIPYSSEPSQGTLLLQSGRLVGVETFEHRAEEYFLDTGFHLERESLVAGGQSKVIVRTDLFLNDYPADIALIQDPVLTLTATDLYGTVTSQDIRPIKLLRGQDLVHEFTVPDNLVQLHFRLQGTIQNLSKSKEQTLVSHSRKFEINIIDETRLTACPVLVREQDGYAVDVLGKNGEALAGRRVQLTLTHGDFTDPLTVQLKTDSNGRVHLGPLPGVRSLHSTGFPAEGGLWPLIFDRHTDRRQVHGAEGQVLRLPYNGSAKALTPRNFSLLELRDGVFMGDRFPQASLQGAFIELRDLPAGDYDLWLRETEEHILVRIARGKAQGGWIVGKHRALEMEAPRPHVLDSQLSAQGLKIRFANVNAETRVHVFATDTVPAFDAYDDLEPTAPPATRAMTTMPSVSSYNSGRQIGDEYRYILERRFAQKYPGNMLVRPGLLLNPWSMRDSSTSIMGQGGSGGRFGGRRNLRRAGRASQRKSRRQSHAVHPGSFLNLDYLASGCAVLTNLRPAKDGTLFIPAHQLGSGQHIRFVVADDHHQLELNLTRGTLPTPKRDRRLAGSLPPDGHFSEARRIDAFEANSAITLRGATSAQAATFDTLGDVFQFYRSLHPESELELFAPLMGWPKRTAKEKLAFYSEFACHELHVFLYHKDRPFFDSVLRPYLENKAEKTFVDLWLFDRDLSRYLDPWAFERLNAFEQALLARRRDGQTEAIVGSLRDQVRLEPSNPEEFETLHAAALAAGSMSQPDGLALALAEDRHPDPKPQRRKSAGGPQSPGPSGPSSPGPGGPATPESPMIESEALDQVSSTGSDDFFLGHAARRKSDSSRRAKAKQFFRKLETTRQYAEHNYFHQPIREQGSSLIEPNEFWLQFAASPPGQPFLSPHFVQANGSLAEMLMALAVLDLPFEAGEHTTTREGNRVTLVSASPLLLVRKELGPASADIQSNLLIGQQFYPLLDRFKWVNGERHERLLDGEFIAGVPYGCRVVVSNPTSEPLRVDLLLQIPSGAIPVMGGFRTRGEPLELKPYGTQTVEYGFYFPRVGEWTHFPAHITREDRWLAAARPTLVRVLTKPSTQDTTSWEYISQEAKLDEVLEYLRSHNLLRVDLGRLAWRMFEPKAFVAVTELLSSKHNFNEVLWSYGLFHGDPARSREYLLQAEQLIAESGSWLHSPLLDIDPIEQLTFERLEFRPLVGARAHATGTSREIHNRDLYRQYTKLMEILAHKPQLEAKDWLSVTYHLLLQNRVEEALASFAHVDPGQVSMNLQYDYMRAYLDFFSTDRALARGIAEQHKDHPVLHWRERFQQILAHLDEAEGRDTADSPGAKPSGRHDSLASAEPSLQIEVEAGRIKLGHRNLESVEIRYYVMDVEFLFSTSPFVQENAGSFNFVMPNRADPLSLPAQGTALEFDLPAEFRAKNVLVEARAQGLVARDSYYANTMDVAWIENYGQLKVTHATTGKPLARVYVKVFSQSGNSVLFHKDGYTDIRGRFDYVSVSGVDYRRAKRFAVLVFDPENGAVIRELAPPEK